MLLELLLSAIRPYQVIKLSNHTILIGSGAIVKFLSWAAIYMRRKQERQLRYRFLQYTKRQ